MPMNTLIQPSTLNEFAGCWREGPVHAFTRGTPGAWLPTLRRAFHSVLRTIVIWMRSWWRFAAGPSVGRTWSFLTGYAGTCSAAAAGAGLMRLRSLRDLGEGLAKSEKRHVVRRRRAGGNKSCLFAFRRVKHLAILGMVRNKAAGEE